MIVASNSLTLSNVNDGTITHTAYAYSADGTDRFTTVYPNLNLLNDGRFSEQPSPKWTTDGTTISKDETTGFLKIKFNGNTVNNRTYYGSAFYEIPTGQKYSISVKAYSLENSLDVKFGAYDGSRTITITNNGNLPKVYKIEGMVTTGSNALSILGGTSQTLGTLFISEIKLEKGEIATPYMPSSSEVKTSDYPSYRGEYSDFSSTSSTDPSKYSWGLIKGNDSYTHTAYSWSADGTDRFTTVYPNLNLLNFKSNFTFGKYLEWSTGMMGPNNVQRGTFDYVPVIPNAKYTFSANWTNGSAFSLFGFNSKTDSSATTIFSQVSNGWIPLSTSGQFINKNITITIPSGINFIRVSWISSETLTLQSLLEAKPKVEQGSIATPWMPSESESQEQWQDAIPMYVGVGDKDSQNPSDYRWQLNPRYVQASSDSGLSNKVGLDDLASVADTANDALVQAQNAVSNEDYTSWLEHDYQTTINNLQDVSAQNQEDINNVDDRTTIVEGFYREMKVKWNFIDESFTFSEEGMFISNAQSKMAIQVTSDKIVFWDNNVDVAFITGEVLNIQKGVFLESATIGNHLITKFSDDSPVTIIRYVGGIT